MEPATIYENNEQFESQGLSSMPSKGSLIFKLLSIFKQMKLASLTVFQQVSQQMAMSSIGAEFAKVCTHF